MVALNKIASNFFSSTFPETPAVKPVDKPVESIQAVASGKNPFASNKSDENFGVGLVNSSLENFSYTLPNGKSSSCNTRWIA